MSSSFRYKKAEGSPGLGLWQTTVIWQRKIKLALKPFGISHAQFVILAVLKWFNEQNKDVNQSTIISFSKLDKMIVSKSIKALQNSGLITNIDNNNDSRSKLILLTESGYSLIKQVIPIVEDTDEEFFGKLDVENYNKLLQIFGILNST